MTTQFNPSWSERQRMKRRANKTAAPGGRKDFKCESEVFNGPKCKTQCERCKPHPLEPATEADLPASHDGGRM